MPETKPQQSASAEGDIGIGLRNTMDYIYTITDRHNYKTFLVNEDHSDIGRYPEMDKTRLTHALHVAAAMDAGRVDGTRLFYPPSGSSAAAPIRPYTLVPGMDTEEAPADAWLPEEGAVLAHLAQRGAMRLRSDALFRMVWCYASGHDRAYLATLQAGRRQQLLTARPAPVRKTRGLAYFLGERYRMLGEPMKGPDGGDLYEDPDVCLAQKGNRPGSSVYHASAGYHEEAKKDAELVRSLRDLADAAQEVLLRQRRKLDMERQKQQHQQQQQQKHDQQGQQEPIAPKARTPPVMVESPQERKAELMERIRRRKEACLKLTHQSPSPVPVVETTSPTTTATTAGTATTAAAAAAEVGKSAPSLATESKAPSQGEASVTFTRSPLWEFLSENNNPSTTGPVLTSPSPAGPPPPLPRIKSKLKHKAGRSPAAADGKANNCKGNTQKSQAQKQEPQERPQRPPYISDEEAMAMITWGEGILKSIVTAERSDPSRCTYWKWVGTLSAEDGMEWQLLKLELDEIAYALPPHERTKEQQELLEDHGLRAGQRWWKERQAKAERLRELQEKSARAAAQGYKLVSIEEEEKRALESQLKPQSTRPWPLINGVRIDDITGYIPVPESKQESLGALVEEVEALLGLDVPLPEGVSSDPPQETGQQLPNGSSLRVEFPEFETKFVPNPSWAARLASAQRSKENEKHHQRAREALPATPVSPSPSRLNNSNSSKNPSQSDLPSPPPQGPLVTTFPRLASDEKIWQELHPHSSSCKYVTAVNREKSETSRAVITSCPCRGHEHLAYVEFEQEVDVADVLRHVVWLRPEELIKSQARRMKQNKEKDKEEEMPELVPAQSKQPEQPEQKQQNVHVPPPAPAAPAAPAAPDDDALPGLVVPPRRSAIYAHSAICHGS
ncbi:poly(p)/ATP NAD kinase [Apiospora arundinis]